jgi:predicted nucleic acid-binding protein
MRWLLDTGPLVAFFDRSDGYHGWAKEQWAAAPAPLLTCEPVLAEACYLLSEHARLSPHHVLALVERGLVAVHFRIEEHIVALSRLLEKYRDQDMQLADACLVRMSEEIRDCRVFTTDRDDFSVYRRNGRQVIPLVSPD